MTNREYIKSLPIEKLAKIIVIEEPYDDMIFYVASNGKRFMFRDEAIDENIEWLNSKRNGKSYLETLFSL
ncbi:unknown [Clostridium sp. CAG:352]|jgi:hypothetical protein|uniref:hypothetical protein n=1 Tax=Pseudoruminococcus massiliensis TaxID=2086583 RepID=UPI00033E746F|nr:unknown [Clostridium sp. CAG:352]SCI88742.1 Uncharacterised protein [uncultured Ruminococcus sp.]